MPTLPKLPVHRCPRCRQVVESFESDYVGEPQPDTDVWCRSCGEHFTCQEAFEETERATHEAGETYLREGLRAAGFKVTG